jgi:hypothetical protein
MTQVNSNAKRIERKKQGRLKRKAALVGVDKYMKCRRMGSGKERRKGPQDRGRYTLGTGRQHS